MKKLSIVFMGTPQFSTGVLKSLNNNELVEVKGVITGLDKKVGRGQKITPTHVATYASENNLTLLKTDNVNKESEFINSLGDVDVFIVIAFSQFLSDKIINTPTLGCFNIHTSLLPKYRGAAPIQYALLNGDKETGVSIQRMVKKMDAGDIAYEKIVAIDDDETSASLFQKLSIESSYIINDFIAELVNNNITYRPQDEANVSFAPTIKKEDGLLNFKEDSALDIINKIKAYTPWPGTYTYINEMRIKVHKASVDLQSLEAGRLDATLGSLLIGTKKGTIRLESVQLEGKKAVHDYEFLNGHKNKFDKFEITEGTK